MGEAVGHEAAADGDEVSASERKLVELLTRRVHSAFSAARRTGTEAALADVEGIAAAMGAALPGLDPFDELIGPFYDTHGLVSWLGKTRQTLGEQTRNGTLIGMQTADSGKWVYPTWQFDGEGRTNPTLAKLWRLLRTQVDPWTAGQWMCAPDPDADRGSAVEWIKAGQDPGRVFREAEADVLRWSR